ncbi:MAG: transposase [Deltaproteobacteria bacterium]|nr:transposase [Deltaproteobacteria bacterium]
MSLKPIPIPPVPPDTARVARAAFRKGNLYLKLRDELGTLVQDTDFVSLFAKEGFPALPPWRLALVTVLQFREQLSDRQAAEAVRARIDWKYLLSLELSDAGFDFSVLSEFRARLVKGGAEELFLEKLLAWSQTAGLVKARDKQRDLLPQEHIVAAAYIDAAVLVSSRQDHGITLVGPPRPNSSWHTKLEGGYNREQFTVEWEQHQVRCPRGKVSSTWTERGTSTPTPSISVHFRTQDCTPCPTRTLCTRSPHQPRHLNLLPRAQFEALQAARMQQASEAGQQLYKRRAGIEGTLSHGVQSFGLRRSRYRGLKKTHLQHVMTAVAMNVGRIVAWLDHIPRATTRTSRFAALAA